MDRPETLGYTPNYPFVPNASRPSRGPLNRKRAKTDLIIALQVVLAIVLLLLVVILVPRPNVRLTSVRIETSACDPLTSTSVVTAYVTLTNSGQVDGEVFVRVWVDSQIRVSQGFGVAARTSANRTLSVPIMDCSSHTYWVDTLVATTRNYP
jgi:hypothetical protein